MTAFALDDQHDIYLGPGGALARVTEADFVVQSIRTRLLLYLAEWWLDLLAGTPWFQSIFVKPTNLQVTERALKRVILGTEGVIELMSFDLTYVSAERNLVVQFEVFTEFGPSGVVTVDA